MSENLHEIARKSQEIVDQLKAELADNEDMDFGEYMVMMRGVVEHHNHLVKSLDLDHEESYLIKQRSH